MIPLDDARLAVLGACVATPALALPLAEALGRFLAAPVLARHPYPNADVSAMDGYALRAGDAPEVGTGLPVAGESRAGEPYGGVLGPGEAVRIFTGAVLPSGADAIVIQEDTRREGDQVEIMEVPSPGAHIRYRGEGHEPGDTLLGPGTKLGPAAVGLLVSDGQVEATVHAPPRVAILGTGDELLPPGAAPETPGAVVDGNGCMIAAFVTIRGAEPTDVSRAGDDPRAIGVWIRESAEEADLLLSTGGASVGDHDVVARAWELAGVQTRFWKVAVRPGKPLRFGVLDLDGRQVPVLALPGNPLAVLRLLEEIVGPALDRMAGGSGGSQPHVRVPLARAFTKRAGRTALTEGTLGDQGFDPGSAQGSHLLGGAARGAAVARVPAEVEHLEAGTPVEVTLDQSAWSGRTLEPVDEL
jgi:molybdopterin molybdotransferase